MPRKSSTTLPFSIRTSTLTRVPVPWGKQARSAARYCSASASASGGRVSYVSSRDRRVTPKQRVTGSEKASATAPYRVRTDWDRSAKFLGGLRAHPVPTPRPQ
jgi:hypothetical protein